MCSNKPVVVFPEHLKFHWHDKHPLKKQLTIYNPFAHPVRFEVESTANSKYKIVDPIGTISPHCKMDIFIRYLSPSLDHCNILDKFRIALYKGNTKECIGVKVINSILVEGTSEQNFESLDDNFEHFESKSSIQQIREQRNRSINPVAVVTAVICLIVIIVLPSPCENNPSIVYSYISTNIKIYCSFILGLITMYLWNSGAH